MIFTELIISSGKRLVRLPAQCARSVLAARPRRCRADGGAERSLDSDIVHYIMICYILFRKRAFAKGLCLARKPYIGLGRALEDLQQRGDRVAINASP